MGYIFNGRFSIKLKLNLDFNGGFSNDVRFRKSFKNWLIDLKIEFFNLKKDL